MVRLPKKKNDEDAAEEKHYTNISLADEAILSVCFLAFATMLDVMGEGLDGVMHWGEGCPCHWVERPLKGPSRHRFKTRRPEDPCPLSSMRATELASGALENVLARIWDVSHTFLLLRSSVLNLCDEERTQVVQEFSRARKHVMFYFMVKTVCWKVLPRALLSLSDHREAVSRQGAKRCLSLYAQQKQRTKTMLLLLRFVNLASQALRNWSVMPVESLCWHCPSWKFWWPRHDSPWLWSGG